jgi:hypothetical protein
MNLHVLPWTTGRTTLLRRTGAYRGKDFHIWGKLVCISLLSVYELLELTELLSSFQSRYKSGMRQGHPRPTAQVSLFSRVGLYTPRKDHPHLVSASASARFILRTHASALTSATKSRPLRHGPILSLSHHPAQIYAHSPGGKSAVTSSFPRCPAGFGPPRYLRHTNGISNRQAIEKARTGCVSFNQGSHVHTSGQDFGAPGCCTQGSGKAPRIQSTGFLCSPAKEVSAFVLLRLRVWGQRG